jgi:hypothetical protein
MHGRAGIVLWKSTLPNALVQRIIFSSAQKPWPQGAGQRSMALSKEPLKEFEVS